MAVTLALSNSTSTLNLVDGTNYDLIRESFSAPLPPQRRAWSGVSLLHDGETLAERRYENRTIRMQLKIKGTSHDNLIANIQAVERMLEEARNTAVRGYGNKIELQYKWANATNTVKLDVLDGGISLPDNLWRKGFLDENQVYGASLTLICKPFGRLPQETIENYLMNPDFELWVGTVADKWSILGGAGATVAKDTGTKYHGAAAAKVTRAGADVVYGQDLGATALGLTGTNVTLGIWTKASTGTVYWRLTDNVTGGTNSTNHLGDGNWQLLTMIWPQPAGQGTLRASLNIVGADGSVFVDKAILVKGNSLPTAWISGRALVNDLEQSAGTGYENLIPYVDIESTMGDVPARVMVYAKEDTTSTKMWLGAIHGTRATNTLWYEGESFTGSGANIADGSASAGSARSIATLLSLGTSLFTTAAPGTVTYILPTTPQGQYRMLVRAATIIDAGVPTAHMGPMWSYAGQSFTPAVAGDYQGSTTATLYNYIDVGEMTIYPTATPDTGSLGTFTIGVAFWGSGTTGVSGSLKIDAVMLMPVGQGAAFITKTNGTAEALLDSISTEPGIYLLDTASGTLNSVPDALGSPPRIDRGGTRLYVLSSAAKGAGFTVKATVEPLVLSIG